MKLLLSATVAAFVALSVPAKADPAAVRATIEAQLDAFRAGDAQAAYALAAPAIKRMFDSPERFISMVKRGYAPVYDAQTPVFLRTQEIDAESYAQEVGLTDRSGRSWTALYTLAKQSDGSWRITGCYLKKSPGQNT